MNHERLSTRTEVVLVVVVAAIVFGPAIATAALQGPNDNSGWGGILVGMLYYGPMVTVVAAIIGGFVFLLSWLFLAGEPGEERRRRGLRNGLVAGAIFSLRAQVAAEDTPETEIRLTEASSGTPHDRLT